MPYLDSEGLKKYTRDFIDYITNNITFPNIVRSFNGRRGDVESAPGDYTPEMVGAVPISRKVNGKQLNQDITLTADDIGITPVDTSNLVPNTRTVNGKALSSNITLSYEDVGALATDGTAAAATKLAASKTIRTNLGSTSAASFNGSANITPGVTGTLPVENGGTGVTSLDALKTALDIETPDLSIYAPKASPIFTGSISLGRNSNTTVGARSIAVGYYTEATNSDAIALGESAKSRETSAVAIGCGAISSGKYSIALMGEASGNRSVTIGDSKASATHAIAMGEGTTSSNYSAVSIGKFSKEMTDGGTNNTIVGDVFVVGNGVTAASNNRSNALRLDYSGQLYLTKAYNSTGADYAEYFEWLDGNPTGEDRVGRFVTLEGNKIKLANEGDYILGVISGLPCVIGNADEDWLGRWEHDDFNRFVKEYLVHEEVEVTPPADVNEEDLMHWIVTNDIKERDGHYYHTVTTVVDYPTNSWRHKANPSYDASQPYIERKDRQEWDAVGMVGVLSVIDDGTCEVNSYCKVAANGVGTKADILEFAKSWRVTARINEHVIQIVKA